jgi:hypothetical protein
MTHMHERCATLVIRLADAIRELRAIKDFAYKESGKSCDSEERKLYRAEAGMAAKAILLIEEALRE